MIRSATLLLSCLLPLVACRGDGSEPDPPTPPVDPPSVGGAPAAGGCPAGTERAQSLPQVGDVHACLPPGLVAPEGGCGSAQPVLLGGREVCAVPESVCSAGFFPIIEGSTGGIVGCVSPTPLL